MANYYRYHYYTLVDLNEIARQQRQRHLNHLKAVEVYEERRRQRILEEAYAILDINKAHAQVNDIINDLKRHPDSSEHLKLKLSTFTVPELPKLTRTQEIELKVEEMATAFGNTSSAQMGRMRAALYHNSSN